jgi:hypothetical protein
VDKHFGGNAMIPKDKFVKDIFNLCRKKQALAELNLVKNTGLDPYLAYAQERHSKYLRREKRA